MMKTKSYLLIAVCLLLTMIFSCGKKQQPMEENIFYTCSMDPQLMERHPGRCPICKMELTKLIMTKEEMESKNIKLSNEQMALGNIKTDTVRLNTIGEEKTLTATTAANESNINVITTRVSGRIENIYFRSAGEKVQEGQKLYDIYSEDLANIQQEYLLAMQEKNKSLKGESFNYEPFINSAKNKLLLYGMKSEQVEELKGNGIVQTTLPIYSKHTGVIMNINARIGDYLMEGMPILKVADLRTLWVEAQMYANEMSELSESSDVDITIASFPDKQLKGKVSFVNLELQQESKINLIRIEIENPDTLFRPGMMAYVTVKLNSKKAITVPTNAVIRNNKMPTVWIQNKEGTFEAKMVTLGIESKNHIEITSGLELGETVVISGAYLLNSEYVFKKGADPIAGLHEHMKM